MLSIGTKVTIGKKHGREYMYFLVEGCKGTIVGYRDREDGGTWYRVEIETHGRRTLTWNIDLEDCLVEQELLSNRSALKMLMRR
jgi:hypothetical protein